MTEDEIKQLKEHSQMLGRIGAYVEDFAKDPEDTVLVCVLRLLAQYHSLCSEDCYNSLEQELKRLSK